MLINMRTGFVSSFFSMTVKLIKRSPSFCLFAKTQFLIIASVINKVGSKSSLMISFLTSILFDLK